MNKSDSEIKFASLITGEEIILTYNDGDYTDNAKLKINGNEAPIKSIEVLREEKTDVWIRVITDETVIQSPLLSQTIILSIKSDIKNIGSV